MLIHLHSGIRWIALAALVIAVISSLSGLISGNGTFKKRLYSTVVYAMHLQLLLGFTLYFLSPKVQFVEGFMKDGMLRFFAMEHPLMMIIGVVLITIGYVKAKKLDDPKKQLKRIFIFYSIGLLLILMMIPWPWQSYGAGWG